MSESAFPNKPGAPAFGPPQGYRGDSDRAEFEKMQNLIRNFQGRPPLQPTPTKD